MAFWDIINPWGALRRERETAWAEHARIYSDWVACKELRKLDSKHLDTALAKGLRQSIEIKQLRAKIATGHFRNPKTGRLGKRGETFSD